MKLELFFDYICPYCYRGHRMFLELLPLYPGLEVIWRPCESHPRPENTYRHSDMAIQGMYYLEECGGDLSSYHRLVYEAHFEKGLDISNCSVLAGLAAAAARIPRPLRRRWIKTATPARWRRATATPGKPCG